MTPLLDLLRRACVIVGKLFLALALVCLQACGNNRPDTDELEQVLVRRARACRASCEEAGLCVSAFKPMNENWGHMEKCECGACASLIGGP